MEWLLSAAGGVIKAFSWFVVVVVVPATIWFAVLHGDVQSVVENVAELKIRVSNDERITGRKLDDILRSLGRVEGQLDRVGTKHHSNASDD